MGVMEKRREEVEIQTNAWGFQLLLAGIAFSDQFKSVFIQESLGVLGSDNLKLYVSFMCTQLYLHISAHRSASDLNLQSNENRNLGVLYYFRTFEEISQAWYLKKSCRFYPQPLQH